MFNEQNYTRGCVYTVNCEFKKQDLIYDHKWTTNTGVNEV